MGALLRDIRTRLGLDFVPYGQSIHSTRELTPGHPVLIAPVSEDKPPWFWTRVAAVDEAHFSLIRDAERAGLRPSLEAGDAIRCYTWREDDARYLFTTPLLRFDSDPAQWVLHHTADLERIQSREYYRLHIQQETRIRIVGVRGGRDQTAWQDRPVTAHFEGEIVNLSGGGVALLSPQTVPVQMVLRVTVKLPGEEPFEVHVEVADAQTLDESRHVLRCRFLDIVEDDRDRIIHCVSQRQMLLLAGDEHAGEEQ
jgi:c-di-GMP-binding flagellar brake protein YcgR